jgi:hypothetical protein
MTLDEYEKLPAVEQKFFMQCPDCRELLDLRNLEDTVRHLAHHNPKRLAFRIDDSRFFSKPIDARPNPIHLSLAQASKCKSPGRGKRRA